MRIMFLVFLVMITTNLFSRLNREIQFGVSPFSWVNNSMNTESHYYSSTFTNFINLEIIRIKPLALHIGYCNQKEYLRLSESDRTQSSFHYKTPYITLSTCNRPTKEKNHCFNWGIIYSQTFVSRYSEYTDYNLEGVVYIYRTKYIKDSPGIEFSADKVLTKNLNISVEIGVSAKSFLGASLKYLL